jgi:hypothetical protein
MNSKEITNGNKNTTSITSKSTKSSNCKNSNTVEINPGNPHRQFFVEKHLLDKVRNIHNLKKIQEPQGFVRIDLDGASVSVPLYRLPLLIENKLAQQCLDDVYLKNNNGILVPLREHKIKIKKEKGKKYISWYNVEEKNATNTKSKNGILEKNKKFLRYLYCGNENVEISCRCCGMGLENHRLVRKNRVEFHSIMELHHFKFANQKSIFKNREPSTILYKSNFGTTKTEREENLLELIICLPLCNNCHSAIHKSTTSGSIDDYDPLQIPWYLQNDKNFEVLMAEIHRRFGLSEFVSYEDIRERYCR